jgi:hypothetical protein
VVEDTAVGVDEAGMAVEAAVTEAAAVVVGAGATVEGAVTVVEEAVTVVEVLAAATATDSRSAHSRAQKGPGAQNPQVCLCAAGDFSSPD